MRDYMGLLRVIEEEKSAMYAVRLNPVAHSATLPVPRAVSCVARVVLPSPVCGRLRVNHGLAMADMPDTYRPLGGERPSAGYWRTTM
jgi:hypothetical protein